jgi:hypothetical protein
MNNRQVYRVTLAVVGPLSLYDVLADLASRCGGKAGRGKRVEEAYLEFASSGTSEADLDDLVELVLSDAKLLKDEIVELRQRFGVATVLRIVSEIEADRNPGYGLTVEQVALLAELGAHLDIDVYLDIQG